MKFIFIRHAHRETSDRSKDNGLSEKGNEQARLLAKYFKRRFQDAAPGSMQLFSSPKKRCIETLDPIAKFLKMKIAVSELLIEQSGGENETVFRKRVGRFLADAPMSPGALVETLVICSHGDWIPCAVKLLCGADVDIKKGSWVEVENGSLLRLMQPSDL